MAIVPLLNGGELPSPPKPGAPVLDREQRPRVDAGSIIGALGATAQSFAQAAVPNPTIPVDGFNGEYQGQRALLQGAENLSQALQGIAIKRAEAKNYADVQETLTAAEMVFADFDQWKEQNPDPESWGPEFARRMEGFLKTYRNRKDLAPQAREQLDSRLNRMAALQTVRVNTEATKATMARAKAAGMARYQIAVENQDIEGAKGVLAEMESNGFLYEDDRVSLEFQAQDRIEAQALDQLKTNVDIALMREDLPTAKRLISESPLPAEEKQAQTLRIEKKYEREQRMRALQEEAFLNPKAAMGRFSERSGSEWKNDKDLSFDDRFELIRFAEREGNARRQDVTSRAVESIALGEIKDIAEIDKLPDSEYLTDFDKAELKSALIDGQPNDPAKYSEMLTAVMAYDPASDETGLKRADLLTTIKARFKGAYADELSSRVDGKVSQWEQAQSEGGAFGDVGGMDLSRTVSDVFGMIDDELKAGTFGTWMVPASQAKRLSQADSAKLEAKEIKETDLVEDLELKAAAARKALLYKQKVEAESKREKGKTPAGLFDYFRELVTPDQSATAIDTAFKLFGPVGTGSQGEPSLMPAGQIIDAQKQFEELLKQYGNP